MRQNQQRVLDSIDRVHDFLRTHAELLGSITASAGATKVNTAFDALVGHGNRQNTANRVLAGLMNQQRALAKQLIQNHMVPIAAFARTQLRGAPGFGALTKRVSEDLPKKLLGDALAMATAAEPYADALSAGGFPPDTIAQLSAAADALSDTITQRASTRGERVGATKAIEQQLVLGREGVLMLDAVIRKQFAEDEPLLAAWRSARRVTAKIGAIRSGEVVPPIPTTPVLAPEVTVPVTGSTQRAA